MATARYNGPVTEGGITKCTIQAIHLEHLTDPLRELALREAAALASLDHPNLLKCYDAFIEDDVLYLVFEETSNTLARVIAEMRVRAKSFQEQDVWKLLFFLASALSALHGHGVAHRAVAPHWVFLSPRGEVKMSLGEPVLPANFTSEEDPQSIPVWFAYAAPETLIHALVDDGSTPQTDIVASPARILPKHASAADVWGLGCVAYELCCLAHPFASEPPNIEAIIAEQGTAAGAAANQEWLEKILERAVALQASDATSHDPGDVMANNLSDSSVATFFDLSLEGSADLLAGAVHNEHAGEATGTIHRTSGAADSSNLHPPLFVEPLSDRYSERIARLVFSALQPSPTRRSDCDSIALLSKKAITEFNAMSRSARRTQTRGPNNSVSSVSRMLAAARSTLDTGHSKLTSGSSSVSVTLLRFQTPTDHYAPVAYSAEDSTRDTLVRVTESGKILVGLRGVTLPRTVSEKLYRVCELTQNFRDAAKFGLTSEFSALPAPGAREIDKLPPDDVVFVPMRFLSNPLTHPAPPSLECAPALRFTSVFEDQGVIARGAHSELHRVRTRRGKRGYVVKVLDLVGMDDEARRQCEAEAMLLLSVPPHAHIVRLHAVFFALVGAHPQEAEDVDADTLSLVDSSRQALANLWGSGTSSGEHDFEGAVEAALSRGESCLWSDQVLAEQNSHANYESKMESVASMHRPRGNMQGQWCQGQNIQNRVQMPRVRDHVEDSEAKDNPLTLTWQKWDDTMQRTLTRVTAPLLPPHELLDEDGEVRLAAESALEPGFAQINMIASAEQEAAVAGDSFESNPIRLCMCMELAENGDAQGLIEELRARGTHLHESLLWYYAAQLAEALLVLHSRRLLHRDIKPANVFLTSGCSVMKLGDLGVGRYVATTSMQAYSLVGTPLYMSPEAISSAGHSMSADLWSLGCVLYELAALKSPFSGPAGVTEPNYYALGSRIQSGQFVPLSVAVPKTANCLRFTKTENDHEVEIEGPFPSGGGLYSEAFEALVVSLLQVNPSDRPTALQTLELTRRGLEAYSEFVDHALCAYFGESP